MKQLGELRPARAKTGKWTDQIKSVRQDWRTVNRHDLFWDENEFRIFEDFQIHVTLSAGIRKLETIHNFCRGFSPVSYSMDNSIQ